MNDKQEVRSTLGYKLGCVTAVIFHLCMMAIMIAFTVKFIYWLF